MHHIFYYKMHFIYIRRNYYVQLLCIMHCILYDNMHYFFWCAHDQNTHAFIYMNVIVFFNLVRYNFNYPIFKLINGWNPFSIPSLYIALIFSGDLSYINSNYIYTYYIYNIWKNDLEVTHGYKEVKLQGKHKSSRMFQRGECAHFRQKKRISKKI